MTKNNFLCSDNSQFIDTRNYKFLTDWKAHSTSFVSLKYSEKQLIYYAVFGRSKTWIIVLGHSHLHQSKIACRIMDECKEKTKLDRT